jgi:hypothetical protein
LKTKVFDGNDTKASGKQAHKGRGWISQAIKTSVGTPVRGRQESATQVVKAEDGRSEVQRASTRMGSANCRVEGRWKISSRNGICPATGTTFKKLCRKARNIGSKSPPNIFGWAGDEDSPGPGNRARHDTAFPTRVEGGGKWSEGRVERLGFQRGP